MKFRHPGAMFQQCVLPFENVTFRATQQTRTCHIYVTCVYMMSVYYHMFVYGFMLCAFIDLYTYFLDWSLVQELGQESLGPRLGSPAMCWDGSAGCGRLGPACRAGCRNREKHENVSISEPNWIPKLNTEGMRQRRQPTTKYTFLATPLQEFE